MLNYGIGGQEVPKDASEAIADIPQNRTLMVEKLTADAPIKPEITENLKTVEEVFQHFKPKVDVDFQKDDGSSVKETLSFSNLGDFGAQGITLQSNFIGDLRRSKDEYAKLIKQLKTNKLLKTAIENPEMKESLIGALNALIQELEDAK